jgi:pimeloyl-ACP methyl ester carboxylesterase
MGVTPTPSVTKYAKNGDAHIAYQVVGTGPIDLVLVPGFVSNVEHYWEMPNVPEIFGRISAFARLIVFDKRGTGQSDPVVGVPALEERMRDLEAVLDAVGTERCVLWGVSEGGPMSLMFAATHPGRVSDLILYGTTPRFSADETFPHGWTSEAIDDALRQIEDGWGEGALLSMFAPAYCGDENARKMWGRYQRAGASPAMGRAVFQALAEIDVRDILPVIGVPTLVLHRVGDRVAPVEGARLMASAIPGAKLVEFEGDDHMPMMGDHGALVDEIEEFLTGTRRRRPPDRALVSVLFTDIVGSTEHAVTRGDRSWRELLESHDALVRQHLVRHDGVEVKRTGDGFLATFDGPARAVRCASQVADAVRSIGIEIRAGVHTGECELMLDDIGGIAVHIAARVMARATNGEVLVSSTVKDLVAGSGLAFSDRGEHVLKGVPGEWHLYSADR